MSYHATENDKNQAFKKGFDDAKVGVCDPPTGSSLADIIFAPIDLLTGGPSTQQFADATSSAYRDGQVAGSRPESDR